MSFMEKVAGTNADAMKPMMSPSMGNPPALREPLQDGLRRRYRVLFSRVLVAFGR
jgi:hypothetical protein